MKNTCGILLLCCLLAGSSLSVPTTHSSKDREFTPEDLSDEKHYEDGQHDADYDHEAFLGEDQSREFQQLSPEESKKRLGVIVDKIDKNEDGQVTREELGDWLKHVSRKYIYDDADQQWPSYNTNKDDYLTWDEWFAVSYGYMEGNNSLDEEFDEKRKLTYRDLADRDKKRFNAADVDGDKQLSKEEFAIFLHPEDTPHMRDLSVEEALNDMDRNKDGVIDKDEYIYDLWRPDEAEAQEEPDWVEQERVQFSEHRDKNGDGHLDKEEVGEWILPTGHDYIQEEVTHLLQSADDDKDGQLSKQEILEHHEIFVGSQVTEFGDALHRHDEF